MKTKIKERPIVLSAWQIQAALAGRLLQVRILMKPQPRLAKYGNGKIIGYTHGEIGSAGYHVWESKEDGVIPLAEQSFYRVARACPYGETGERLWAGEDYVIAMGSTCYKADYNLEIESPDGLQHWERKDKDDWRTLNCMRHEWRTASHMPRKISRIKFELTGVWIDRLQATTEVDAINCGAMSLPNRPTYEAECADAKSAGMLMPPVGDSPLRRYARAWDLSKQGKVHPWESNPWIWVLGIRKVESTT